MVTITITITITITTLQMCCEKQRGSNCEPASATASGYLERVPGRKYHPFLIYLLSSYPQINYFLIKNKYDQVSVYNVFVERGNVAVLQCGVPASVRDSVEVRR